MGKKIITEQEIQRLSSISEQEMLIESINWSPSQWAAYLSKGEMLDDNELDRFIEEEIIER